MSLTRNALSFPFALPGQCAALAKSNLVFATGTEDADALTFGTPILVRHLSMAEARKMPIVEVNLQAALEGLKLTHAQATIVRHNYSAFIIMTPAILSLCLQFVDLCILCGCDYVDSIKGIGPITALKLVQEHGCIESELLQQHFLPIRRSLPLRASACLQTYSKRSTLTSIRSRIPFLLRR